MVYIKDKTWLILRVILNKSGEIWWFKVVNIGDLGWLLALNMD